MRPLLIILILALTGCYAERELQAEMRYVTLVDIQEAPRWMVIKYWLVYREDIRKLPEWHVMVDDTIGYRRGTRIQMLIQTQ